MRTCWENCSHCGGSGMMLNPLTGEPQCCHACGGNGTERARDAKGRFITRESPATQPTSG